MYLHIQAYNLYSRIWSSIAFCIHLHILLHIFAHWALHISAYYLQINEYFPLCIYAYILNFIYVCMYVCMHACMHACIGMDCIYLNTLCEFWHISNLHIYAYFSSLQIE